MKDEFAVFIFLLCFYFGYLSAVPNDAKGEQWERLIHEAIVLSK